MEENLLQTKNISIQDRFLNQVRKEGIAVTIHLVNGFQIRGFVKAFDNYTVVLDSDGKQIIIYKHAVSTITPVKPVRFANAVAEGENTEEE